MLCSYVEPHPTERRLFDAEVIMLTSNMTGSAGEAFALALKATGRATLIGEITAGAGNYGSPRPVSERLVAFVPFGVAYDPVTRQRWEGGGIEPHVTVPAERPYRSACAERGFPGRGGTDFRPHGSRRPVSTTELRRRFADARHRRPRPPIG